MTAVRWYGFIFCLVCSLVHSYGPLLIVSFYIYYDHAHGVRSSVHLLVQQFVGTMVRPSFCFVSYVGWSRSTFCCNINGVCTNQQKKHDSSKTQSSAGMPRTEKAVDVRKRKSRATASPKGAEDNKKERKKGGTGKKQCSKAKNAWSHDSRHRDQSQQ